MPKSATMARRPDSRMLSGLRSRCTIPAACAWPSASATCLPMSATRCQGRRLCRLPLSQIQPGDLLFSAGSDGTASDPGHVVMYLGNGQVIQAPQTGQDVQIDPVDLDGVDVNTHPADLASQR